MLLNSSAQHLQDRGGPGSRAGSYMCCLVEQVEVAEEAYSKVERKMMGSMFRQAEVES